jgi:hypothetical protein
MRSLVAWLAPVVIVAMPPWSGARGQQQPLPLQHAPQPTTAAISAADLMTRLYIFADDSMQGRLAGSAGDLKGTTYIAGEVARLGLLGGGDAGTYFQGIPLYRSAPLTSMRVVSGSSHFLFGRDFIPVDNSALGRVQQIDGSRAVFGGTYGDTTRMIGPREGNERFVIIAGRRDSAGRPEWVDGRRELIYRFSGAAAIAITGLDAMDSVTRSQLVHTQSRVVDYPPISGGPAGLLMESAIAGVPAFLYISEAMAGQLLGKPLADASPGQTGGVVRGDVTFKPELVPARNVIALIPGSDPVLKNQYIVIGAHADHIGLKVPPIDPDVVRALNTVVRPLGGERAPVLRDSEQARRITQVVDSLHKLHPPRLDSVFNGADEGGSGAVAALEIAEAFAAAPVKPKRSILFVWHTGDEMSLAGSSYFATHPTVPRDAIVAELNLDMIGRGDVNDLAGGGPAYLQVVGSRRLATELGDLIDSVARAQPQPFKPDYQHDVPGDPARAFCRGDQFNYFRFGIPSVLFTTGEHRDYRQVTDEAEYVDYAKLARVTSLVFDLANDLANRDHRLIVDKPRPNSSARCVE